MTTLLILKRTHSCDQLLGNGLENKYLASLLDFCRMGCFCRWIDKSHNDIKLSLMKARENYTWGISMYSMLFNRNNLNISAKIRSKGLQIVITKHFLLMHTELQSAKNMM